MENEILELAKKTVPAGWTDERIKYLKAFAKLVEDAAFKRWAAQTKLAVENEREACAKVCEEGEFMTFGCAAEAIRARGHA